jgi:MoxR-vWA-beta-propeller ternary system domain bpX5
MTLFSIDWQDRAIPLAPRAMLAVETPAGRLARKLVNLRDDELAMLRGAGTRRLILMLGPSDRLPWVDGVQYFGIDPAAPSLFLPCHSIPAFDLSIVYKAFLNITKGVQHIVDPRRKWLVPTGSARPVDRGAVRKWLRDND